MAASVSGKGKIIELDLRSGVNAWKFDLCFEIFRVQVGSFWT